PRIARPSQRVRGGIKLVVPPMNAHRGVPVHIDHEHVERNAVRAESLDNSFELLIGVRPVARPPRAERKLWWQRNFPGDARVVVERLLVIVAVTVEIPILAIAEWALHHPRPRAFFALRE